jgi:hypothetical protein
MASHASKDVASSSHDQDLSTILTSEERVELTLLIANIAEVMRQGLADAFEASIDTGKPAQDLLKDKSKNPNLDVAEAKKQKEAETEEEEKARKLRESREKELSAPKMLELKKDGLEFFDKWRESVLSRVGIAVNNSKDVVEEQKQNASVNATPEGPGDPETKILSK